MAFNGQNLLVPLETNFRNISSSGFTYFVTLKVYIYLIFLQSTSVITQKLVCVYANYQLKKALFFNVNFNDYYL